MVSEKRQATIERVVKNRQSGLVVVLEDIHDPHNAEAIFRTCDALGVQRVCLIFDKQDPWNPKKIGKKSSSSAHKWLDFESFRSADECFSKLKNEGYLIVGTTLKDSTSVFSADLSVRKIALVVGNEHRGLSDGAQKSCDLLVNIPMRGMVESLNVSVATALFLYEITRQREGKSFSLNIGEQKNLIEDFIRRSSKSSKRA